MKRNASQRRAIASRAKTDGYMVHVIGDEVLAEAPVTEDRVADFYGAYGDGCRWVSHRRPTEAE